MYLVHQTKSLRLTFRSAAPRSAPDILGYRCGLTFSTVEFVQKKIPAAHLSQRGAEVGTGAQLQTEPVAGGLPHLIWQGIREA